MRCCPWLLIHGIEACLWSHRLTGGRQTLGRSSACDIRLLHATVSRRHAEIRPQGDGLCIRDLQSSNGTFVNGAPVTEAPFGVGDTLRLGAVTVEVMGSLTTPAASGTPTSLALPAGEDRQLLLEELQASHGLSPAEGRVVQLLVLGLSEKEVASRLHLSRHTVHAHTKRIYQAIGVHSRAELLALTWAGDSADPGRRRPPRPSG